jgi:hypothetical protein
LEFCGVWLASATNSSVYYCRFEDCAHPSRQSCSGALQVGQVEDCAIHDNVIREHRGAYGIKAWRPIYTKADDWYFFQHNKIRLVRVKFYNNDVDLRRQGAWGNGQPNMDLELWNSEPVNCEIYSNRFHECVSLVADASAPKTIRVHHNLWQLDPGYNYAIEAAHHNLEIDHNYFLNGAGTISSFGDSIRNLNIHDNTFDGVMDINVLGFPGLTNFRFVNNTVVMKKDAPFLSLGKFATDSSNLRIERNLFVKEGGEPLKSPMIRCGQGAPKGVTLTGNAYWNWVPGEEKSALVADPGLERSAQGDHLLRLNPSSKVLAAGIGNPGSLEQKQ